MFKIFFLFLMVLPFMGHATLAQGNEGSWTTSDSSLLENKEVDGTFFTLFAEPLCTQDNLKNDLCIDFGWREACLKIYFIFGLGDDLPYLLSEEKFPVLKIGKTNKFDINTQKKEKKKEKNNPKAFTERAVLWRVEGGSLDFLLSLNDGVINSLLQNENLKIFFKIADGPVMRSNVSLKGLNPLLKTTLEKAKTSQPLNQVCAG